MGSFRFAERSRAAKELRGYGRLQGGGRLRSQLPPRVSVRFFEHRILDMAAWFRDKQCRARFCRVGCFAEESPRIGHFVNYREGENEMEAASEIADRQRFRWHDAGIETIRQTCLGHAPS